MSVIYQTMTGEVQCILHDGQLYIRPWDVEQQQGARPLGEWNPLCISVENAKTQWEDAKADAAPVKRRLKALQESLTKASFRKGCIYCCLTQHEPCSWRTTPRSVALTEKINALMLEREEAIAKELADLPEVPA